MKEILTSALVFFTSLMAAAGALAQDANPCAGDIARFCSNLQPGKGVIADCLKLNTPSLSSECRESLFRALDLMQ